MGRRLERGGGGAGGALLAIPGVRPVIASAVAWSFALWGSLFIGTETLSATGASVLAVQLTAMASWAPLLLGGRAAGRVAAHVERLATLRRIAVGLGVVMALVAVAVAAGGPTGLVYVATFAAGSGMLANMTLQRPMLYDLAGPGNGPAALALDALGMAVATCLGPLLLGFVLSWGGAEAGYVGLGGAYLLSRLLLRRVRKEDAARPRLDDPARLRLDDPARLRLDDPARLRLVPAPAVVTEPVAAPGAAALPRAVVGFLGVTVIMNVFYFPFLALIPVLADRFTDASWSVGVLAAAPGLGMVVGTAYVVLRRPARLGGLHLLGAAIALAALVPIARATGYPMMLAALLIAGFGISGFTGTQAALAMGTAPAGRRSHAMGLLASAIGVLPLGILGLGFVARQVGPVTAVSASGLIGFAGLLVWSPMWRALLVVRTEPALAER